MVFSQSSGIETSVAVSFGLVFSISPVRDVMSEKQKKNTSSTNRNKTNFKIKSKITTQFWIYNFFYEMYPLFSSFPEKKIFIFTDS